MAGGSATDTRVNESLRDGSDDRLACLADRHLAESALLDRLLHHAHVLKCGPL